MGIFDHFRRNKEISETDKAVMIGLLQAESHRSQPDREAIEQLAFNPHLMRTFRLEGVISELYKWALEGDPQMAFYLVTIATAIDGIIRVSNNTRLDANIGFLKIRRLLRHAKMNVRHIPGFADWVDSIEVLVMTAFNDSIGGWKARLTKVTPRTFEIAMRKTQGDKGLTT